MKPVITLDAAVSALPRLPSASSRARAVMAMALTGAGRCEYCARVLDSEEECRACLEEAE